MLDLDKSITISGDLPEGGFSTQYTLPYASGVYIFASGEEPSYIVHILSAILSAVRGENVLPALYDPNNQYQFSVEQDSAVRVSWQNGAYEVLEIGPPGLLASLREPSSAPAGWVEDVMITAYPRSPRSTGKLREVLDAVTSGFAVALLNPEHSLHPGALRALVYGIFELRYESLVLIETVSPSLLSDYARCCGRPPEPPIIFQLPTGLISRHEIDERRPNYLGHFDIGDLYHADAISNILSPSSA